MANTYTQIHIHVVCAVKYRQALIHASFKERLHNYIAAIVQNHDHKMLAINSVEDHIHFLMGFRPHESIASLLRQVKSDSSEWINKEKLTPSRFRWQEGYGAFSYSKSAIPNLVQYIKNQEAHHRKTTMVEEYTAILDEFNIQYDPAYIFKLPE